MHNSNLKMGLDFMKESKVENLIWIIIAGMGEIIVIIGLVVCVNTFNYSNKVDTIGIITEISSYGSTKRNRSHEVYVSYTVEGKEYELIFKSKNIWTNPENIIEEKNIKQFPVYIDNNKKKYIIDIEFLTKNIVDLR